MLSDTYAECHLCWAYKPSILIVIMLIVIMLIVIMLIVIMLNVIILSVTNAECH